MSLVAIRHHRRTVHPRSIRRTSLRGNEGRGSLRGRRYLVVDANYRLTDLTSPALALHFARDAMGDIVALGNAPGASPASETYSYDPLYRLTGVIDNGTALETYTYNPTGDRMSKTASGLATGVYLYAAGTHQLASIGNAARINDADGNTTASVVGGNTYGFGYNGRNRMTVVQLNGLTIANYTYNAFGDRIGKVASFPQSMSERYGYNEGGQLLGEYGTTNRDYIWLGNIPVAIVDNTINGSVTTSTVNYVTADQLNTPRAVTDSAGTLIWQLPYQGNPFDEQQPTSSSGYVLNLRYSGQYYDAESRLSNWGIRSYEAATSRSPQSDPIGLYSGQWSTYAYADNNSLMWSDPSGEYTCDGTKGQCNALSNALSNIGSAMKNLPAGSRGRKLLNGVLDFYGTACNKNGVTVGFGSADGNNAMTDTQGKSTDITLNLASIRMTGSNPGTTGAAELASAVAHEGQHGIDGQFFGPPVNSAEWDVTENNAYTTQSYVDEGLDVTSPYGLWNKGWNENSVTNGLRDSAAAYNADYTVYGNSKGD